MKIVPLHQVGLGDLMVFLFLCEAAINLDTLPEKHIICTADSCSRGLDSVECRATVPLNIVLT